MTGTRTPVVRSEPAVTIGSLSAVISAVIALVVVLGVNLPEGLEAAIIGVVAAAGPIVAGLISRTKVTANSNVVESIRGATVVAGQASELATGTKVRDVGALEGVPDAEAALTADEAGQVDQAVRAHTHRAGDDG
ncbi:hypothetical protein DEO23_13965 [Brachybacterium endophyticum]|uniref:Holin n=1 Tax=Brachybacterium endophyticum TaxID=2182385 RepID=A0A2U2RH35_9MICO|nr:hypothetical protein [Brachybacterium endophyticum]PWH05182.1 hypothetical protein DEO23_13965 [Brachybacterium endophyticum]